MRGGGEVSTRRPGPQKEMGGAASLGIFHFFLLSLLDSLVKVLPFLPEGSS